MQILLRDNHGKEATVDLPGVPSKGDRIVLELDGAQVSTSVKEIVWSDGGDPVAAVVDGFGRT